MDGEAILQIPAILVASTWTTTGFNSAFSRWARRSFTATLNAKEGSRTAPTAENVSEPEKSAAKISSLARLDVMR
jgi:hypothetical protein